MMTVKQFGAWLGPEGQGLLDTHPFQRAKLIKPKARAGKFFPQSTQIADILKLAIPERYVHLRTLACTGLRVGEFAMLRRQDVDLELGFIHVRPRPGWSPKTGNTRKVPIHPELLRDLKEAEAHASADHFFPNRRGSKPAKKLNDRQLLIYMQALAKQCGIPIKRKNGGIVIHSFRDFFETTCVNAGVPHFVVDIWMGHAAGRSQGQTYYGLTDEKSHEWMKRVRFDV